MSKALTIGDVVVHPLERLLERDGERQRVDFKAMEVLLRLASAPGEIVTKEDLFSAVWPDGHVSESVLPVAVRTLRRALGDDAASPVFIETIPRVGYRLVAEVSEPEAARAPARHRVPVIAGSLLVALAGAAWWVAGPGEARPVVVEVRPLTVDASDTALAILAEEVCEHLVSTLSREPGTLPQLERQRGTSATHVISGSARRHGEQVRLTVRVTSSTGVIWSPIFEVDASELSSLPGRVQWAFRRGALPALIGASARAAN